MNGFVSRAARGCAWLSGGAAAVACVLSLGAWGSGDLLGRIALWGWTAAGAAVLSTALAAWAQREAGPARSGAGVSGPGARGAEWLGPGGSGPKSGGRSGVTTRPGAFGVRAREVTVWLLIALASATLLVASFQQHHREPEPELRRAGAVVAAAVVAHAPSGVQAHTSEGRVLGWTSRLELTVPGSAEPVRASAYTYAEPKAGDRVLLLHAPSQPALEGRVDERKDLRSVAGPGSWEPFPQVDEARKAVLLATLLMLFVLGAGLAATAVMDPEELRALPRSGRARLCWTAALLLALALHLPALYGHPHPVAGAPAWISCLLPALGRGAAYAVVRGLS
ncbi:hypothetical protein [Streptomyces sp. TBY4]|uniref:hypothetical protein n=1 Tax=Streptomyces sp. TBY4 TaxID=2962030 RepID=UPI0020B6CD56|nr:hypothetical protein [Streptomyces sp. TBY4]MCP3755895.1 hypothetical protein [Streptomyces sp. TBY4]